VASWFDTKQPLVFRSVRTASIHVFSNDAHVKAWTFLVIAHDSF